jgi:DNA replicative helicase MCM subunit Mcm2 (Cdc46/Mcm family)
MHFLLVLQEFVHARVRSLPCFLDAASPDLSPELTAIGAQHRDKLVTVRGRVVRAQGVQLFGAYRTLECGSCKALARVVVPVHDPSRPQRPDVCPAEGCECETFRELGDDGGVTYTNYQEIALQASSYNASAAQMPRGLPVVLMHELADCCQVGDEVEVTGVIVQQAQGALAPGAVSPCCHVP